MYLKDSSSNEIGEVLGVLLVHKTANVLNALAKSAQAKAKEALHEIWMAETRADAQRAFDQFINTYQNKNPKATEYLEKNHEELLMFYYFAAVHWHSLRTTTGAGCVDSSNSGKR